MATAYLMEDTVQALQVLTSDVFSGFGEFSDDVIRAEVGSMRSMVVALTCVLAGD